MSTLKLCEKYFQTRDVYKLFESEKTATDSVLKKAYYKLSLQVHPDRVDESEKEIATEKFKILSKLYHTLIDKQKRALYDEQGIIDDDDLNNKLPTWLEMWKKVFKPITEDDIVRYEKSYKNSELERADIKMSYLNNKGCLNKMMDEVPFFNVEDEPRVQDIVNAMIDAGEIPEYKIFTNEPAQKRKRRHQKYARESKRVEKIQKRNKKNKEMDRALQKSSAGGFNTLLNSVLANYESEDDADHVEDLGKMTKKRANKAGGKKSTPPKNNIHAVKKGKVNKRKN